MSDMNNLTKTQEKLYLYLKKHQWKRSTSQMAKYLGLDGKWEKQYVQYVLNVLDKEGLIEMNYVRERVISKGQAVYRKAT